MSSTTGIFILYVYLELKEPLDSVTSEATERDTVKHKTPRNQRGEKTGRKSDDEREREEKGYFLLRFIHN